MEHVHRAFPDRLWRRLSNPVPKLPGHPRLRSRLYGAVLLIGACAAGWSSSEALKQEAIEAWKEAHPPQPWIWKLTAEARGLRPVVAAASLRGWYRRMPQDFSPHSAWWDPTSRALWVLPGKGESPEILLFTGASRPAGAGSTLTLLGRGWEGLEAFRKLELRPESPPRPSLAAKSREDPRLWNF